MRRQTQEIGSNGIIENASSSRDKDAPVYHRRNRRWITPPISSSFSSATPSSSMKSAIPDVIDEDDDTITIPFDQKRRRQPQLSV